MKKLRGRNLKVLKFFKHHNLRVFMQKIGKFLMTLLMLAGATAAHALIIPMYIVTADGGGKNVGWVQADDTIYGVLLKPHLHGLPPGVHGFHIHTNGACEDNGMAAGGHLDPYYTDKHAGPYGDGHLGDLPVLIVNDKGRAYLPVLAPRLKVTYITGKSLMIHQGGDNYSEFPNPMGGGGGRLACGVIPYH
jgi:Cu-Zn family superoxide dismutase